MFLYCKRISCSHSLFGLFVLRLISHVSSVLSSEFISSQFPSFTSLSDLKIARCLLPDILNAAIRVILPEIKTLLMVDIKDSKVCDDCVYAFGTSNRQVARFLDLGIAVFIQMCLHHYHFCLFWVRDKILFAISPTNQL